MRMKRLCTTLICMLSAAGGALRAGAQEAGKPAVEELQAQIRALQEENRKLKGQAGTAVDAKQAPPATVKPGGREDDLFPNNALGIVPTVEGRVPALQVEEPAEVHALHDPAAALQDSLYAKHIVSDAGC